MKKILPLIILLGLLSTAFGYATPTATETPQFTWREYRVAVDTNDTALAATTKTWATRPESKMFSIPQSFNNLAIRFRCDPNSTSETTATYTVYVYSDDDDAELVCTGTITRGDQVATMGSGSYYYAETITVTSVWGTDILQFDCSGANGMANIKFDHLGAKYLYVQITSLKQYDKVSVDVRGF